MSHEQASLTAVLCSLKSNEYFYITKGTTASQLVLRFVVEDLNDRSLRYYYSRTIDTFYSNSVNDLKQVTDFIATCVQKEDVRLSKKGQQSGSRQITTTSRQGDKTST